MNTKLKTLTITLAAFLGLAAAASARHPEYREMKKVKYLAHELSVGAQELYEHSRSYARHPDRYERDALYALHELAEAAHHFYEQVGRYYREPGHTERDFRVLVRTWREASYGFTHLAAYDHHRYDFRCLRETMDKLAYYYGGYGVYERDRYRGRDGYYDRRGPYDDRRPYRYRKRPGKYHRIAHGVGIILDAIEDDKHDRRRHDD